MENDYYDILKKMQKSFEEYDSYLNDLVNMMKDAEDDKSMRIEYKDLTFYLEENIEEQTELLKELKRMWWLEYVK